MADDEQDKTTVDQGWAAAFFYLSSSHLLQNTTLAVRRCLLVPQPMVWRSHQEPISGVISITHKAAKAMALDLGVLENVLLFHVRKG
jgi:hypothetical protein